MMSFTRKLSRTGGIFYILTFVFSIPTLGMKTPLHDPAFVLGAGSDSGVLWAALFDFLTGITGIGTAVALYPVIQRVSRTRALGFITSRVVEAGILMVGALAILAMVSLHQDYAGAGADVSASVQVSGLALLAVHDWSFLFGPGFMAVVNALLLGTVMYQSRLVPRWIPTLGLIGAPLLFVSDLATLFGAVEAMTLIPSLLVIPLALWELSLGIYLTVKGFRPSPILDGVDN